MIDINSDLGESYGPWTMGDDKAMLGIVTSANVACGGHASDPETMFKTLTLARERGVVVGAHPGYPDREGFGRRRIPFTPPEIERFVAAQIGTLMGVAALAGTKVRYVKPHGALGNLSSEDADVAAAIMRATKAVGGLAFVALAGTLQERVAHEHGLETFSEIFADRGYTVDGNLVPRSQPGAMIHDASAAADSLVNFMKTGLMPTVAGGTVALKAHTICVHGDGPTAVAMARHVRSALEAAGIAIKPFLTVV